MKTVKARINDLFASEKEFAFTDFDIKKPGNIGTINAHDLADGDLVLFVDNIALNPTELGSVYKNFSLAMYTDTSIETAGITLDQAAYASAQEIKAVASWAKQNGLNVMLADDFIHISTAPIR